MAEAAPSAAALASQAFSLVASHLPYGKSHYIHTQASQITSPVAIFCALSVQLVELLREPPIRPSVRRLGNPRQSSAKLWNAYSRLVRLLVSLFRILAYVRVRGLMAVHQYFAQPLVLSLPFDDISPSCTAQLFFAQHRTTPNNLTKCILFWMEKINKDTVRLRFQLEYFRFLRGFSLMRLPEHVLLSSYPVAAAENIYFSFEDAIKPQAA